MKKSVGKYWKIIAGLFFLTLVFSILSPDPLFDEPTSTVVFDRNSELLGARIADDGQWRFPASDSLPYKFEKSILSFEDQYFYWHPGINPFSIIRALIQNIKEGEIVSGGSTITMQVVRLSRKGKPRTLKEKLIEALLALKLEFMYSKNEILSLYASYAPFGGNVVGLETAAWRYFSTNAFNLSWAECTFLAILPNAPSLIHPGKNRNQLLNKRNRLLKKLLSHNIIDSLEYQLAVEENLPEAPGPLPKTAYHLTERLDREAHGKRIITSIESSLQEKVNRAILRSKEKLYTMGIHNAACLVVDVESGNVLAYMGNIRNPDHPEFGGDVDIIPSKRSSGSILKPLLYASMQYRGELLPHTLISDIPTRYGNYSPKNFNRGYDGVVPASEALIRSLNVPAVRMLHTYGTERFYHDLKKMGLTSLNKPSDHYGLSLILGGAECSLEDLASVYASLARVLNKYTKFDGKYFREDWKSVSLEINSNSGLGPNEERSGEEQGFLGAGAIWITFQALKQLHRPEYMQGWELFTSSRDVAWKTGTSFGFRDGWAVGSTPEYVVAVWTGNADGEGRPGISGINTAAPLLFEVLSLLPSTSWFETPFDDLVREEVCQHSGHQSGRNCTEKDSILICPSGINTPVCPFHRIIHLDQQEKFRVNSNCYPVRDMVKKEWFILPPAQEWYYRQKNPSYKPIPPYAENCMVKEEIPQIQLIYPDPGSTIYIPYELNGEKGRVVFEAAHRDPQSKIFWSIDDKYIATTSVFHQISVLPSEGNHTLTLVDVYGNRISSEFKIIDR